MEIWHLTGTMSLNGGAIAYDQRLTRRDDDSFVLTTEGAALLVDRDAGALVVDAPTESWARQLVTTYGLPLLIEETPALVLHACAAVPPGADSAHVVCAASGTGKSTLLAGLVSAGWQAVSEDVSVIDLRGPEPVVWPGPPWVRSRDAMIPGASVRFESADKRGWDIEPWQVDGPVPVARIAFMQPAGTPAVWRPIEAGGAIARLVGSTIWLTEPGRRGPRTFGRSADVAARVAAAEIRVPVAQDWVANVERLLREE
jgi:hypothetical protein